MEKELDNNVLKLLACVKYKHKNINNIISDPEIYCLLEALLKDDNCQQSIQDILNNFNILIIKQTDMFPLTCRSNFAAIRKNCNKENILLFLYDQNAFHFSWNITTCIDELYELTAGHIMNIQTEEKSTTSLCHLNAKHNKIKYDATSKQVYKNKFKNLNNKIIEELKKIKVNNDETYNQICNNIEKNRKTITENNKNCSPKIQTSQQQQENKASINQSIPNNNDNKNVDNENNRNNINNRQDGKRKDEGHDEGKPINNDEAKSRCLCKDCSCNIWPFN